MRHYIAVAVAISFFAIPWVADRFPEQRDILVMQLRGWGSQLAAVITHNPRTVPELHRKYAAVTPSVPTASKVRVLVMPGHEPGYGGAEYRDLKERELTVQLSRYLEAFLRGNGKYEVIVPRDETAWAPEFQTYFKEKWDEIVEWQKAHKEEALRRVAEFGKSAAPKVHHNAAPSNVAYRLYGITKWSNENAVDIAIHVHFNDYPGHAYNQPGKYSGFSIYVPEGQYLNSTTTRAVAEAVFKRLSRYNPVSDLPGESGGIVDESELIAVGANNTADAASMLIEYAYIYEPLLADAQTRDLFLRDLAYQTYLGIEDFFNPGGTRAAVVYDTMMLPYTWNQPLTDEARAALQDVFALQTALIVDGVYPPQGKSKNDCPRTGKIGSCTRESVKVFQAKHGIETTGTVGPLTVEKLNSLYSLRR